MLKLMDLLTEGVYDKGIFKAVFMAGGPGSGKTYISSKLFGIPEKHTTSFGGLKVVNSDKQFVHLLKKFGFDPTMLARYPDEVFQRLGAPMSKGGSGMRDFAQAVKSAEKQVFMEGKLGMIIDSTGSNFALVHNDKFLDAKSARHKFSSLVKNVANPWVGSKPNNPKAKQLIKDQLRLKKAGYKK